MTLLRTFAHNKIFRSGCVFQCTSNKKKFSFREQTRKKLRKFSPFSEGETALMSADPVFPPITLLIYLCAALAQLNRYPIPWGVMNCLKPEISPSALEALGTSQ